MSKFFPFKVESYSVGSKNKFEFLQSCLFWKCFSFPLYEMYNEVKNFKKARGPNAPNVTKTPHLNTEWPKTESQKIQTNYKQHLEIQPPD